MDLIVDQQVASVFPNLSIGVLHGKVDAQKPSFGDEILALREGALQKLSSLGAEALPSHPNITAWREAYERFGVKAKKYPPTHESLAKRLLKAGTWPNINPIVDVYLTNQVAHLLPHGGYDETTLTGDVSLVVSAGGEVFEPLGGGSEATDAGEIVYRDGTRVLTRRWNYRDADSTKITESTAHFVLMVESPSETIPADRVAAACQDLADRYARCFEGSFDFYVHTPRGL
jgi:DNA/RNA-binding domain of Phe-tRNA-synthetase-like protein